MVDFLLLFLILVLKIFLFDTAQSTDFEVHRNWKAITNSLPISKWYFYSKNQWTLDYPPLFAYMEYILGKISKFFDEEITDIDNINYISFKCKIYMRSTVLLGDLLLFFGLKKFCKNLSMNNYLLLLISVLLNCGLVLVDNIHFQYNSLLFGIFFFSLSYIQENNYILAAVFYCICLCMKHIFLYFGPAYFIFYLKHIVIAKIKAKNYKKLFIKVILICISMFTVFFIVFLPFISISIKEKNLKQFIQIKDRLFPVQRGLLHTYWAPNFWAIYSFVDKVLFYLNQVIPDNSNNKIFKFIKNICKNKNLNNDKKNKSALGAQKDGVSQISGFDVLPDITIKMTNMIIVTLVIIYFVKNISTTNKKENKIKNFIRYSIISNLIFFNFGYQVHEKAFIIISILTVVYYIISFDENHLTNNKNSKNNKNNKNKKISTTQNNMLNSLSFIIVLIGILAQLPLIHEPKDYLYKISLVISYVAFCKIAIFNKKDINSLISFKIIVFGYLFFSIFLDYIITFQKKLSEGKFTFPGNKILMQIHEKYPFLFLMMYSVNSSLFTQTIFILLFLE